MGFLAHLIIKMPSECQMSRNMTKPTKWHVRPAKTQIRLGPPSLIRVFTVRTKKHWVLSYPLSAQRSLWSDWASLGGCPGWSESLLGAQPFCWFCHVVAQMPVLCPSSELMMVLDWEPVIKYQLTRYHCGTPGIKGSNCFVMVGRICLFVQPPHPLKIRMAQNMYHVNWAFWTAY